MKSEKKCTKKRTVLGFDSFMEAKVLDTYEANPHSEATEVMICS